MSHFAKVVGDKVTDVIVAEPDFFETFVDTTPGEWIQTSYNTFGGTHKFGGEALRKNFASVGFTYNRELDAFIPPQPYASWKLNEETCLWEPPVSRPNDNNPYVWDEASLNWVLVTVEK